MGVRTSWDGESFGGADVQLDTPTIELNEPAANHEATLIRHYVSTE